MNPCGPHIFVCIQLLQQILLKFGVVWGFIRTTVTVLQLMSLGFPELVISVEDSVRRALNVSTAISAPRGGAGCPPAAHGHCAGQISMHSHERAHSAAMDEAWRKPKHMEQPWAGAAARGEQPAVGPGAWGSCHPLGTCVEQCLTSIPSGSKPCWGSAGRAAACGKLMQDQF